jgi:hypothetical protein
VLDALKLGGAFDAMRAAVMARFAARGSSALVRQATIAAVRPSPPPPTVAPSGGNTAMRRQAMLQAMRADVERAGVVRSVVAREVDVALNSCDGDDAGADTDLQARVARAIEDMCVPPAASPPPFAPPLSSAPPAPRRMPELRTAMLLAKREADAQA